MWVILTNKASLSITGRKKDLIIRGGVNISPAAIEEALMHIRGVADVAVVSIPHELYGEDIVAVLKLEAGVELESDAGFSGRSCEAQSGPAPATRPLHRD